MKGALKDGKNIKGPGYRTPAFYRLAKNNLNNQGRREEQLKFKARKNAF